MSENFACEDCGCDTKTFSKYYMVWPALWEKFGVKSGVICPKCFVIRLGRPLQKEDLTECSVNRDFILVDGLKYPEREFFEDLEMWQEKIKEEKDDGN